MKTRSPIIIWFSENRFQIEELLSNLFSNAIKYTLKNKKGLIQVTAQIENGRVKVSITDNGKGLNEEEITHVFDKYYKGKTDRKQMDSSGLGLNICKSIVQKHGGTISVSSPGPGKGSTFSFTIPLNDESAKPCCKKEQNPKQHIEDIHTKIDSIIAEN